MDMAKVREAYNLARHEFDVVSFHLVFLEMAITQGDGERVKEECLKAKSATDALRQKLDDIK